MALNFILIKFFPKKIKKTCCLLGSWSLQCWQPGTAGCRFCLGAGARGRSQGPGRPGATKGPRLHKGQARAGESVADSTLLLGVETSMDFESPAIF